MFEEGQLAKNTNDSVIKKEVDKWFKDNIILGEDDLEDTVFCNDRSMYRDPYMSGHYRLENSSDTYYSAYGTYAPVLDCANEVDRFTRDKANGNGDLTFPIALITADEATMAGACWSSCSVDLPSDTRYISYLTKSYRSYRNVYYTMTPLERRDLFSISTTGRNGLTYDWFSNRDAVRPVVSLKADTRYTSGDGTAANPYIVEK